MKVYKVNKCSICSVLDIENVVPCTCSAKRTIHAKMCCYCCTQRVVNYMFCNSVVLVFYVYIL